MGAVLRHGRGIGPAITFGDAYPGWPGSGDVRTWIMDALNVVEIFPSFQGEGLLVGVSQVFVRLGGCNLRCSYCDTPEARGEAKACRVYGREEFLETVANPLAAKDLAGKIASLWSHGMHSVSLTGGEPLLQVEGLADLLPLLRDGGMAIYLETNGTLPAELEKIIPWVDWIAMDLKLPYSQEGKDFLDDHREFLRLASRRKVFLKVVVEEDTPEEELEKFCRGTAEVNRDVPLVLQPKSVLAEGGRLKTGSREGTGQAPRGEKKTGAGRRLQESGRDYRWGWRVGISPTRAGRLQAIASAYFREVRVIPQLHRAWGMR